jgi:hypothetical protein
MNSALFSIFFFSTWGLGLLTWLLLLGLKAKQESQEIEMNRLSIQEERMRITDNLISQIRGRLSGPPPITARGGKLNSQLQDLIKTANSAHPEVNEIDPNDLIIGVRFEGGDYPPTVDDENEDS